MNYAKLFIVSVIGFSLVGCWSAEETKPEVMEETSNVNSENVNTNTQDDFEQVKKRLEEHISESEKEEKEKISDGSEVKPAGDMMTPTETLREFDAATIAKDAERVRKVLSKSSLEFFEKEAQKKGMTFKQLIEQPGQAPSVESPEFRNEKINGNKATVEAKNAILGSFDTYPLIKEDGVWKVAYDLYFSQKIEELNKASKPLK